MNALRIAIAGAGTAGTASAVLLARAGHQVTLLERVSDPGPVGAGIVLQPTGMSVLKRNGLHQRVFARGAPIHRLHCQTSTGREVVHLEYETHAPGLYGLGLHRGVLFETLFAALKAERRCTLELGVELAAIDGDCLVDSHGEKHGPFDLIVLSDGARSKLRQSLPVKTKSHGYPYGALWFVADDEPQRFRDELFQIVKGTKRLFGLLPTGFGPGEGATHKVSLFWSLRADELQSWRERGLGPWKEEILSWAPQADAVLAQIQSVDQVLFSTYQDVVMERWHHGKVVVLGDAAHAMSPQLGQGCNLALMDAQALADAVERAVNVGAALDLYEESRREHLAWYQFATRWLTPLFQSDWPVVGPLRDALMGWSCKVPFVGQQMVDSMCGVSMGPLLPSLPLPEL